MWHCLESDVVTNPQDHPQFQAVFVGRTPSVTALALRDVVVAFCPMEDFSTTSSSATQLLLFKVCVNRRKSRLVSKAVGGFHRVISWIGTVPEKPCVTSRLLQSFWNER